MFKLHYNVYEKVEELAKLLAQSSEYTELQAVMFPDTDTAACGGDCSRCQGCGGH